MRKFFLAILVLALPLLTSAQGLNLVSNYSEAMSQRLAFGLNRNTRLYNKLVNQSVHLAQKGKNLSTINIKLTEAKIIIDRGQTRLTSLPTKAINLTSSSTPRESYLIVRQLVREIIQDIRLSYVKIRQTRLLIKKAR